ncbi:cytidylyltransferase domain-containing protein [Piscinibacter koreensis]|uniref:Acylneuraminate cytidylyltransferase family protein n=1 Tax=Piscinibacter koreensis TaxID=2742824 RepID=A0A7Y6TVP0_9BURK|nr:acylneuraminate cytidylyltransferase family protein [Schlegelella koreensis]NUZ05240.1 acylneuraminate cytidylyltransferase family protein [Schlegelella koreensis]
MLRGEPLTAIIPVRGGSRGIPGKNLRPVAGGDSLLERAIKLANRGAAIDRVIVSTDDPAMHAIATRHGVQSPTLRPAHLADDTATTLAVVDHVLAECGVDRGALLILQATSPFRTLADLDAVCRLYASSDADAVVSLAEVDEPRPEKLKRLVDGYVAPYLGSGFEGPRQALPQPLRLNGAFYLVGLDAFRRERSFLPRATLPYLMPDARSHNLDSSTDWQVMEAMIAAGHWRLEDVGP